MGYNGCRGLEGSQIEQQQGQCERFFNRSNESWGSFDFARQARVRAKRKSSFSETDIIIAASNWYLVFPNMAVHHMDKDGGEHLYEGIRLELFSGAVVQWHGEVMKHFTVTTVTDMGHPGNETFGYFLAKKPRESYVNGRPACPPTVRPTAELTRWSRPTTIHTKPERAYEAPLPVSIASCYVA
jgi:hypothetical protein